MYVCTVRSPSILACLDYGDVPAIGHSFGEDLHPDALPTDFPRTSLSNDRLGRWLLCRLLLYCTNSVCHVPMSTSRGGLESNDQGRLHSAEQYLHHTFVIQCTYRHHCTLPPNAVPVAATYRQDQESSADWNLWAWHSVSDSLI